MVAPRRMKKVFCTVVRLPLTENTRMSTPQRFSTRPSDLIPWADPYIAQLVTKLQKEVRSERMSLTDARLPDTHLTDARCGASTLAADLEPPTPDMEFEGDWRGEPRWTFSDEM